MKVRITLVEQKGECPCRRGHQVGDEFDFDEDRWRLCPLAMHVLFPMVDILRYGGNLRSDSFCRPDVDTINVFRIDAVEDWPEGSLLCNEEPRGEGFRFVSRGSGDVALQEEGARCDVQVYYHDLHQVDGKPVSLTRIRKLLAEGALEETERLLSR